MTLADWGGVAAIIALVLPIFTWILRNIIVSIIQRENKEQAEKQNKWIKAELDAVMVRHLDRHHGNQNTRRR